MICKRKSGINIITYLVYAIMMLHGCKKEARDFFEGMNVKHFTFEIDSNYYFLKNFHLSNSPIELKGKNYWLIQSDAGSYFPLAGYLRKDGSVIKLVPIKNDSKQFVESKLFDFTAMVGSSWRAIYKVTSTGDRLGDSIILTKKTYDLKDTIYSFELHQFWLSKKIEFEDKIFLVEVSQFKGIVSISKLNYLKGIDYKAILCPKQKFTSNRAKKFYDL